MDIVHVQISAANVGYDALRHILEFHFGASGHVWQFYNVPEAVWYAVRKSGAAQAYIVTNVIGIYPAKRII